MQAGGPAALARHISQVAGKKISTQAISQWLRCPTDRVLQVVSAPGVEETPQSLRPDIYPPAAAAAQETTEATA